MKKVKKQYWKYITQSFAFVSFLYSVSYGLVVRRRNFVGIWVPSILAMSSVIRQRRNDLFREQAAKRRRYYNTKEKENDEFTINFRDVYYWFHYLRTLFVGITNYDLQKVIDNKEEN